MIGSTALLIEELADRVIVTLNRPEVRNAIDLATVEALHEVCTVLEREPRVLILQGSGGDFAAGADLHQLRDRGRSEALRGINSSVFHRVAHLPMPVIALLDGNALGGGAELAYAADFRIGTPRVKIGNPEPVLGILAAAGATWRLKELVGEPIAKEILLAGRVVNAPEALELRLLNEIVEPGELTAAGDRWVTALNRGTPLAIQLTKAIFHQPRSAHPFVDNVAQAVLFETDEKHDRISRFLKDRP